MQLSVAVQQPDSQINNWPSIRLRPVRFATMKSAMPPSFLAAITLRALPVHKGVNAALFVEFLSMTSLRFINSEISMPCLHLKYYKLFLSIIYFINSIC